jgi:hypothetical protein
VNRQGLYFSTDEVIMNSYMVEINYGKKAPAFSTTVEAPNEAEAKRLGQVLAKMSGWSEVAKKVTAKAAR